jgi:hypothetical protein
MVRSRLLFIILLLAYLGVTPVGVYTCACLMPEQPNLFQVDLDDISKQTSSPNTAVASLISFFSIAYMLAAALLLTARRSCHFQRALLWLEPNQFCEPPPTPPPHFV